MLQFVISQLPDCKVLFLRWEQKISSNFLRGSGTETSLSKPVQTDTSRGETRALIGGGGCEYSYLLVLPDEFHLKSAVIKLISKEIRRAEHEYMNIHPPPPINALVSPLNT